MVSRESALVANNILLAVSAFVVFIGTIWPLVAEMLTGRGRSRSGEPFFNAAFTPFFVALAMILPVGRDAGVEAGRHRAGAAAGWCRCCSGGGAGRRWPLRCRPGGRRWARLGLALGPGWSLARCADLWSRTGRGGVGDRLARLTRLPRADWGKATAHAGLGVTIFAVAAMNAWVVEDIRVVQVGETFPLGAYEVTLVEVHR